MVLLGNQYNSKYPRAGESKLVSLECILTYNISMDLEKGEEIGFPCSKLVSKEYINLLFFLQTLIYFSKHINELTQSKEGRREGRKGERKRGTEGKKEKYHVFPLKYHPPLVNPPLLHDCKATSAATWPLPLCNTEAL
jgi:hypothetical protein